MKKYKVYKNSGIEWLGEIPEHWKMSQMKRMFSFGKGLSITKSDLVDDGIPVISYGQIHSKKNSGTSTDNHLLRYVPKSFIDGNDNSSVSVGDFIFADTSEDIEGCGNCVYIDQEGIYAGYHAITAKSNRRNNKFFAYLFLTDLWRSQIRSMVYGVKVYSITKQILSQAYLFVPPIKEQDTIVDYLDSTVGKIDSLISAKEKQVEDLQQYRSSIISEAVTRGLHHDVEFKETDGDKFNEVPSHWDVSRLKYSGSIKSGDSIKGEDILPNGKYEVFGGNGFMGFTTEFNVIPPAIIIGRVGALCGNVRLINDPKWITDNALILKLSKNDYRYVYYMLIAYDLNSLNTSNAQPLITGTKVINVLIPVPPISEQQEIAGYLDANTSKIYAAIKKLKTQIEDLRQYKKSVICEAVTGKVDLRDWKPK